ncbi:MAG: FapA family protein [Glaciecola sp.]
MKGVSLNANSDSSQLFATIDPLVFGGRLDRDAFLEYVATTDFAHFHISDNSLLMLSDAVNAAANEQLMTPITQSIGKIKDADIIVEVAADHMSATLKIETPSGGDIPSVTTILNELKKHNVVRGISKKRIRNLIQIAADADPGKENSDIVARGLPPKKGKDSYLKPLIPNALDRVLAPKESGSDKVDMRDLGDILSVKVNQAVARRVAPGKGRLGYTVSNKKIKPSRGKWKDIKLGNNTKQSPKDENTIIATVAGQPKFENERMSVDDTYTTKGVNVGTGNIKYDGAVIVNGDVTENMKVHADGDITINGFVESAVIRAGGDIIITQGATGKMNTEDCQLIANGSIFVQHGQGLDIIAGADVHVAKQLAYSKVKCRGSVTVGSIDKPMGNLFASTISCYKSVVAGSVGAVSGSVLTIDFSDGYNLIVDRLEALTDLFKVLSNKNANHEIKVAAFKSKHIPANLRDKLDTLHDELQTERVLLNWLQSAQEEMQVKRDQYEVQARVIANKELFPGVTVKLNKRAWRGQRECPRCRVILEDGNWLYDPIV